jgi:hypothetical protein
MSRIRQIKPSWFLDKELRRGTTADAREFYIGLWMLADDEGWLVWDVERIAAELYPYEAFARRERNVVKWAGVLMALAPEAPHLKLYTCGHACVPHMKQHQRVAGTRSEGTMKTHRDTCRDVRSLPPLHVATGKPEPDGATSSHGSSGGSSGVGNVEEGTVVAPANAPEGAPGATEWQRRVPRPVALGGRVS